MPWWLSLGNSPQKLLKRKLGRPHSQPEYFEVKNLMYLTGMKP